MLCQWLATLSTTGLDEVMHAPLRPFLAIVALAIACSVPPESSVSTPPSTLSATSSAPIPSVSSAPSASRGQYAAKQLFELQITPSAIAGDVSQVYVAEVALGARPANTLSTVV